MAAGVSTSIAAQKETQAVADQYRIVMVGEVAVGAVVHLVPVAPGAAPAVVGEAGPAMMIPAAEIPDRSVVMLLHLLPSPVQRLVIPAPSMFLMVVAEILLVRQMPLRQGLAPQPADMPGELSPMGTVGQPLVQPPRRVVRPPSTSPAIFPGHQTTLSKLVQTQTPAAPHLPKSQQPIPLLFLQTFLTP